MPLRLKEKPPDYDPVKRSIKHAQERHLNVFNGPYSSTRTHQSILDLHWTSTQAGCMVGLGRALGSPSVFRNVLLQNADLRLSPLCVFEEPDSDFFPTQHKSKTVKSGSEAFPQWWYKQANSESRWRFPRCALPHTEALLLLSVRVHEEYKSVWTPPTQGSRSMEMPVHKVTSQHRMQSHPMYTIQDSRFVFVTYTIIQNITSSEM